MTLCRILSANEPMEAVIEKLEKKKENKNPPLLFNLAELQNECSRLFKLSPDETLKLVQELYEKKAGDLSTNRRKGVVHSSGKGNFQESVRTYLLYPCREFAKEILEGKAYQNLVKIQICE